MLFANYSGILQFYWCKYGSDILSRFLHCEQNLESQDQHFLSQMLQGNIIIVVAIYFKGGYLISCLTFFNKQGQYI